MQTPTVLNPYREPRQPAFVPSLLGPITRITAPTGQVVTLEEAKAHLRVTIPDDDDEINRLIAQMTRLCEEEIPGTRQFLTATYEVPVAHWLWEKPLQLPRPPLQGVTWIKYYDTAGMQQTLDTTLYEVLTPWKSFGRIMRAPNKVFPPVQCDKTYPITVRFDAGYGLASDVPDEAKAAIFMLVFDRYNIRGATAQAFAKGIAMPYGVENCLNSLSSGSYA